MAALNQQYVLYTRKSTDDADNQKNSLDYQSEATQRYAEAEGIELTTDSIDGFMENGLIQEKHSGFKTSDLTFSPEGNVQFAIERPKFQQLIQLLLAGKYRGIVCLCWDRISRNDQDDLVIKNMMDRGVDVRFVQVRYDKTSSGALHRDIDGMFSQHYSRVISEKVRNTFEKFRRDGRCLGQSPIGYFDQGSDCKPFDPDRAPIVVRCFELYATGQWSYTQLANWANTQGLTTKASRARRTRIQARAGAELNDGKVARPITGKSIEKMLTNPFYIGQHKDKKGKVRDCKHAPLIPDTLYYKVRNVAASHNVTMHYLDRKFFPYRGLINCGSCRRTFSPYVKKGHTYYRCRCRAKCANHDVNLTEVQIDTAVAEFLGRLRFTEQELAQIEKGAASALDSMAERRTNDLGDLERERKRIYADLDYLMKNKIMLLRTGACSVETYGVDNASLEEQLEVVHVKMNAYKEAEHEMLDFVLTFSDLISKTEEYFTLALDSEKRALLTLAITELIFLNGKFTFSPKDGFQALFSRFNEVDDALFTKNRLTCGLLFLNTELRKTYAAAQVSAKALTALNIPGLRIETASSSHGFKKVCSAKAV
jgi:site-specific DNA recombinase